MLGVYLVVAGIFGVTFCCPALKRSEKLTKLETFVYASAGWGSIIGGAHVLGLLK